MKLHKMEDPWESISDLMTGLMMIFLFVSIAFISMQQKTVEDYNQTRLDIYNDLAKEFSEKELSSMGARLDKETMAVVFEEPDMYFVKGQSYLTPKYSAMLSNFFPRYIAVLTREKFQGKISEIRIEGHASREWAGDPNSDAAYFYNMKLSQDRAMNVLQYIYSIPALQSKKEWLREHVSATGLSYRQAKATGNAVDRRVEFRVRTNAEELMKLYGTKIDD